MGFLPKRWIGFLAVSLSALCALPAAGGIMGLEAVPDNLPWYDAEHNYPAFRRSPRAYTHVPGMEPNATSAVTSVGRPPMEQPLSLMLSRFLYPAEDGYFDAIVRFDMPLEQKPDGRLAVEVRSAEGQVLASDEIADIPGSQTFFSFRFPEGAAGTAGTFAVRWTRAGQDMGEVAAPFRILEAQSPPRTGRIPLRIPNDAGGTVRSAPMTVGVPFPHGALDDAANMRLVDAEGNELPMQARATGRWSRFGPVKWALLDFAADLDGGPRELFVEYGPDVRRAESGGIGIAQEGQAFPRVDAGRLRLGAEGIYWTGEYGERQVVGEGWHRGAFVEHVSGVNFREWGHFILGDPGDTYVMPADAAWEVEHAGPESITIKAEGYYKQEGTGREFCRYVVRIVVHRDSPVMRIFHTWIYTGDDVFDRIRSMGWRFPVPEGGERGFLSGFGPDAQWLAGDYLLQHDHDKFGVFNVTETPIEAEGFPVVIRRTTEEALQGSRAAGALRAGDVHFGVKDFWQNYPHQLAVEKDAFVFYQWPLDGMHRRHRLTREDAFRLWFAHEGEVLSFTLPMELTEGPLYVAESGPEPHFAYGRPESVNAQGIAKTAEMWLAFAPEGEQGGMENLLQGLNEETVRAVVDPAWLAASGAFYEIHHQDWDKYPQEEAAYEMHTHKPREFVERIGIYGKWIYGDLMNTFNLEEQTGGLYRQFRKAHHGWPYSWTPFARSGDARALRFAQAATRMMSDIAFCHYVSDDVAKRFDNFPKRSMWDHKQPFRAIGFWNRNIIPWAGYYGPTTRMYVDKVEDFWHAYYLTGYERARDVIAAWARESKVEQPGRMGRGPITAAWNRGRWPVNQQKQYVEMYQATFDPWFLAGARALAEMRMHVDNRSDWNTGAREYQRLTGCEAHREFYLELAARAADAHYLGWASYPSTYIPDVAYGYLLTGDEAMLRRAAGVADMAVWGTWPREPDWYRGLFLPSPRAHQSSGHDMLFTGWFLRHFPAILGAMERAEGPAVPLPPRNDFSLGREGALLVRKDGPDPLPVRLRGHYRLEDAQGNLVAEGEAEEGVATIPVDAPPGAYRFTGPASITLPAAPLGVPEVVDMRGDSRRFIPASAFEQHWFLVPEGVESFWIEVDNRQMFRMLARRADVWNPDGESVWQYAVLAKDFEGEPEVVRGEIAVPPEHRGKLWRMTLPGLSRYGFALDPQIPAVFAHTPDKFFLP